MIELKKCGNMSVSPHEADEDLPWSVEMRPTGYATAVDMRPAGYATAVDMRPAGYAETRQF
ncbi:MAG: hypothetical protein K6F93_01490 [Lachnospiraceae bacterium]|nr:hypothetical protein [Lachnospiraceae bacterium]